MPQFCSSPIKLDDSKKPGISATFPRPSLARMAQHHQLTMFRSIAVSASSADGRPQTRLPMRNVVCVKACLTGPIRSLRDGARPVDPGSIAEATDPRLIVTLAHHRPFVATLYDCAGRQVKKSKLAGREDSNLRMAESKSDYFSFKFNTRSEKIAKFDPLSTNRLAPYSECRCVIAPHAAQ
jgi:hypothetical protein